MTQKEKGIQLLELLDIYKPYINGFKSQKTKTCYFENFAGFWSYQNEELEAKKQELEAKYGFLVYAITHEYTDFGECYSFLIIPKYENEWDDIFTQINGISYAYAYVWNKSEDMFSEFGDIAIKSFGGGIKRIG